MPGVDVLTEAWDEVFLKLRYVGDRISVKSLDSETLSIACLKFHLKI